MRAERLAMWMRKHPARVTTYRLEFAEVDGGEEVLGEWDKADEPAINTLAEAVVESAQMHCDEMQTSCRYRVRALDKEGKSQLATTMRQQPEGAIAGGEAMRNLEDASAGGITAQAIRHTEAMTQMLVRAFAQILNVQGAQVDQLQKALGMYQKREGEMLELARTLATTTEDSVAKERNADRLDRFAEVVTEKLGPAVLKEIGLLPADFGKAADVVKLAEGGEGEGE